MEHSNRLVRCSQRTGDLPEDALAGFLPPNDDTGDPTVKLTGTVSGTSALTGTAKKPKTGASDGRATIASITGTAGVNTTGVVRCLPAVTTNCLAIGAISASVVDRILETEDPQAAMSTSVARFFEL